MITINKHGKDGVAVLIVFSLLPLNCLGADLVLNAHNQSDVHVSLEKESIPRFKQISGKIGFCGITDIGQSNGIKTKDLCGFNHSQYRDIQKYLLNKLAYGIVDCDYDKTSNKFERSDVASIKSSGWYPCMFDVYKENKWSLYDKCLEYLNVRFKCDYYLTGAVKGEYDGNINKGVKKFRVELYLVVYDNQGRKIYGGMFTKVYDDIEKNKSSEHIYYSCFKRFLDDYSQRINADLGLADGNPAK